MNLYHLRYFATLAHLEHYTKAAEILAITQPSLSHAIASLEKELGVKLFEKEGRNVALTKCGQAFLIDVEQALDMIDSSVNKLQMTGRGEGRIDIVELRALSSTVVPNFVKGFLDSTPDKKIDFYFHSSTGLTSDMIQGLKDRKYDIAFCSMMDNEPLIEFTPVAKQELVLIVSANCLLYGRRPGSCRSCRCRLRYRSCSKDAGSFLYACIHYRNRKAFLGKTLLYGYFKECLSGACYHGL